ncbi:MAG: hypothetical protein K9J16_00555 [Melioribacteraceae bacterium]|nr:hypothetical protein [Melioribacteraceae bacterium]MCF8354082.1 hypothetical protein [Melioribacteraceae bacterium]MCF8393754.1 hypothetical protein [Melioribacteraceae bacterium]MCF8419498.1 hypothetical protein [Melioribacteraceae bacterium]
MRVFAILTISIGTIGAAITAAHIPPLWLEFIIFLVITGAGIYLNRKKTSAILKSQNNSANPLNQFRILIDEYVELVTRVIESDNAINSLLENSHIEHLYNQVEQVRVGIINQLGMKKYISIISPFARAERLLYRGYSSATDEYYDEAKQSLTQSLDFFKMTKDEINKIMDVTL